MGLHFGNLNFYLIPILIYVLSTISLYVVAYPVWPDWVIFAFWASIQSIKKQLFYQNRPHC